MEMWDESVLEFMNLSRRQRKTVIMHLFDKWHELKRTNPQVAEDFLIGLRVVDSLHHASDCVREVMES
jgi:hypothetical protein